MPAAFGDAERHICHLFSRGERFSYGGTEYEVQFAGKPTCSRGEPKTDVYVLAASACGPREFKISVKQKNADFLENKTNSERAALLFGPDWQAVICRATTELRSKFESRPLIYKRSSKKTKAGAITLGWKFELVNVKSGALSGDMFLTRAQVIDVYSGTNLPDDKRNANVDGRTIPGSGVANFLLFAEPRLRNIQEAADMLITVEDHVNEHPNVYFACKALNYRSFAGKYDGNRPLAVYVDWRVEQNRLVSGLNYDSPLLRGGDYAYERLDRALGTLGVRTTDDLDAHNVADICTIWNG